MANTLANFALYVVLYAVLTFYCWECTEDLSLDKLKVTYPVVAVLWIVNFAVSVAVWILAIQKNIDGQLGRGSRVGPGPGPSGTNGSSTSTLAVADVTPADDSKGHGDFQSWNSVNTQL